jgi:hypothetical protein
MVRREVGSRNLLRHKQARKSHLQQKLKPEIKWKTGIMAVMIHTFGVLWVPLPLASVYLSEQETHIDVPVQALVHFMHNPVGRGEQ